MKCQWCVKAPAEKTAGELSVCGKCEKDIQQYHKCTVCGCEIDSDLARFRRKRFETGTCLSASCSRKELIARGSFCCERAQVRNCSCARSLDCDVHGILCTGTHN